ncbi:hypothetical protein TB2_023790 [Malus domestica]
MMKYFKSLILLGLLLGSVVLVSSAAEAETSKDEKKVDEPKEVNQGGGGYCGRCCYRYGRYTCGGHCCWPEVADQSEVVVTDDAVEDNFETKQPDGYGGWGGGGRGGGGWGGGGRGGGGWGGGGRGRGGSGGGGGRGGGGSGGGGGRGGGGGWGGGGRGGGGGWGGGGRGGGGGWGGGGHGDGGGN